MSWETIAYIMIQKPNDEKNIAAWFYASEIFILTNYPFQNSTWGVKWTESFLQFSFLMLSIAYDWLYIDVWLDNMLVTKIIVFESLTVWLG